MGSNRMGMKRELASLLKAQIHFSETPERTRSSNLRKRSNIDESHNVIASTQLKGLFSGNGDTVHGSNGRLKNKRVKCNMVIPLCNDEEVDRDLGVGVEVKAESTGEDAIRNLAGVVEFKEASTVDDPIRDLASVVELKEASKVDDPIRDVAGVVELKEESKGDDAKTPVGTEAGKIQYSSLRRFTRSVLNTKVVPVNDLESDVDCSGVCENDTIEVTPKLEEVETTEPMSEQRQAIQNMELAIVEYVVPKNIPSTIKEILITGLMEGLHVTYYDAKKPKLKGIIKGLGILCSCNSCKGLVVVSPSKFEHHAIHVYRHMAKFTYLDNGKSLRDVLDACKASPLDPLENTIQRIIGDISLTKTAICDKCGASVISSGATYVGSVCSSCAESKDSPAHPNCTTGRRAGRPPKVKVASKSPKLTSPSISSPEDKHWKITKKNHGLHKVVFEDGGLPDGTELAYYSRGKKLLEGYKKGPGIFCHCCNSEVSASTFEVHAGCAPRKKPYNNIFTSNGVSLHELAIHLSKDRKFSPEDSDDICIICRDGGSLLLCDGCPRAYHRECASLSTVPRGKWYCKCCENMFIKEKFVGNVNAVAAGRISGVDSIDQITRRCIRIFETPDAEIVSTCVLCRSCDFSKSSYGPRTIIICDQCEMEFHVGCLKDKKIADLKEIPVGKWFCSKDCTTIHSTLQNLLARRSEKISEALLNILKTKQGPNIGTDINVSWRLLSGKYASPEVRLLLSKAVAIFHNCFDPIVDQTTGLDIIPPMIYGRDIREQEFGGMYCAVLLVDSSVVSAGIIRVFGREFAELPLVATCKEHQGKGYFQILFSCIMKLLASLQVKSIVLPAAHEAESLWVKKLGFNKIDPLQLSNLRKNCCQMITFQGTTMLEKIVSDC